jgi:hypothetical protein
MLLLSEETIHSVCCQGCTLVNPVSWWPLKCVLWQQLCSLWQVWQDIVMMMTSQDRDSTGLQRTQAGLGHKDQDHGSVKHTL